MRKGSIICMIVSLLCAVNVHAQLEIIAASCENKINPLGIAVSNVHFSWELSSKENNQYQKAYQIVIASSKEKLNAASYNVWNSAVVKSSNSVLVNYTGKQLQPAQTYYWRVRVWGKNNKPSEWSSVQQLTIK